ncbi:hypothetical protein BV898_03993 [Hypsibius exemplaris]|uniref:Uncharacterized protein n=1 Tax=Hypsibius exemplaris TaxID=2072580 RepID=A0A1W0X3T0_HYPEX|nr:hypothetical protein BV898_03993 [Hypsibius exemplaris]
MIASRIRKPLFFGNLCQHALLFRDFTCCVRIKGIESWTFFGSGYTLSMWGLHGLTGSSILTRDIRLLAMSRLSRGTDPLYSMGPLTFGLR